MAKEEQGVAETSQGNEETRAPATALEKLQAMFSHGASFNFGQPYDPPIRGKLQPVKFEPVQPTLEGCTVTDYHDGGPWIAFKVRREGGEQRCKTRSPADATELKKLMADPATFQQGRLGKIGINIDPVGNLISV